MRTLPESKRGRLTPPPRRGADAGHQAGADSRCGDEVLRRATLPQLYAWWTTHLLIASKSAASSPTVVKNVVAAGLAERVEVEVAYAIGKAAPVGLFDETFGSETVDPARIEKAITSVFDLRPGGHRARSRPAATDLRAHRRVRTLRSDGHRPALGTDRTRSMS
jgi:hypothetical protein